MLNAENPLQKIPVAEKTKADEQNHRGETEKTGFRLHIQKSNEQDRGESKVYDKPFQAFERLLRQEPTHPYKVAKTDYKDDRKNVDDNFSDSVCDTLLRLQRMYTTRERVNANTEEISTPVETIHASIAEIFRFFESHSGLRGESEGLSATRGLDEFRLVSCAVA